MSSVYAQSDNLHMTQKGQDLMFEKISEIYKTGSITNLNNTSNNTTTPVSLTANEKDRMVAQPTLQIRIPGLNFTEGIELFKKDDGNVYLYSKFFQQYIVAVYRYSVVAISILAVFMIIVAGIQWMISGGSPDKIKAAQKRIGQSIVGLLIAVGSYTILYTINPYLVGFKALETEYIPQIKFDYSGDSDDMVGEFSSPSNIYCPKTGGASELPKIVNSMIGKVAYRFGGKGGAPPYAENKPECMKFNNFCPPGNLCLDCSGFVVYALKCAGINNINGGSGNVLKNTPLYTIDQVDFDKGTIDGIPLKTGDLIVWIGSDYGKNCGNKQFIGHVLMFVKKVEGESGENFLAESSGGGCDEKNLGPEKSNSGRYANKNIRIKRFSQYKDKYFPRLPCPSDSRKIRVYRIPN